MRKRRAKINLEQDYFINQIEPNKRALRWWQQIFIVLFCLLAIAAIYFIFFTPNFKIQRVAVEGTKNLNPEQVASELDLENQNIFLINEQEISEKILQHPEAVDYRLVRVLPTELRIIIEEREPILIWQSQNKYYQVDQRGIAFKQVNDAASQVPKVIDIINVNVVVGEPVVPISFIVAFGGIKDELGNIYGDQISHYEIEETVYDLDLILKSGHRVRFNILSDINGQLVALRKISEKRQDLFDKSVIDLRVDRWAFIR